MASGADVARAVVLDDRYSLDAVIGQGGMATVYRAHDRVLGRDVAIKLFPPVMEDADDLLRHQAEMRVLAQLNHPGLVTLHDAGWAFAGGPVRQTYLVMELVTGPTLAERLTQGPLSPAHTALIGRQVAEALAAVHAADVVHRDIKPANVLLVDLDLLPDDGVAAERLPTGTVVKLADFGIARLSDGARLTATGTTLGTATYLSPEQAAGGAVGPMTDIYALGLVLLECLTGHRAFTGTMVEVAAARLTTAPPIPSDLGADWVVLLGQMTRRAPEKRPTAVEVAAGLTAIMEGRPGDIPEVAELARSAELAPTARSVEPVAPTRGRPARAARPVAVPPSQELRSGATPGPAVDHTRRFSTAEVRAHAERTTADAGAAAKSRRAASLRTAATGRRRRGVLATTAVLVVAAGALLVGQLSNDGTS
ncbi:MAG TPA: serine/threonine-protein kinase, partial [Actinotalea sp.]